MLKRWQFHLLNGLGVLSLLLALANATLFMVNRETQAANAHRQQYIQQSIALENLYREIVKALAESGARDNDRAMLDILGAQGLTVSAKGSAAAPGVGGSGVARK